MSKIDLEKNFKYLVLRYWLPRVMYPYLMLIITHSKVFIIPELESLSGKKSVCYDSRWLRYCKCSLKNLFLNLYPVIHKVSCYLSRNIWNQLVSLMLVSHLVFKWIKPPQIYHKQGGNLLCSIYKIFSPSLILLLSLQTLLEMKWP